MFVCGVVLRVVGQGVRQDRRSCFLLKPVRWAETDAWELIPPKSGSRKVCDCGIHSFTHSFCKPRFQTWSSLSCCCCLVAQFCQTLWDPMACSTTGFPVLHYHPGGLLKPMSIEPVMPSNRLIIYCPLLLLPSIFPSISVFSNESALHIRWPKYWNFSLSISPSNEYSRLFPLGLTGLISLLSEGLSKVIDSTTVRRHQFFSAQPSLGSSSHIPTWLLEKP